MIDFKTKSPIYSNSSSPTLREEKTRNPRSGDISRSEVTSIFQHSVKGVTEFLPHIFCKGIVKYQM